VGEDEEEASRDNLIWRGLGFFLALVSSCGLAAIQFPHFIISDIPYSGGGIFGMAVALGLIETFSIVGTTVLLFGFFLCGITLFTGFSWLTVSDFLGKSIFNACAFVFTRNEKDEEEKEFDDEEDDENEDD